MTKNVAAKTMRLFDCIILRLLFLVVHSFLFWQISMMCHGLASLSISGGAFAALLLSVIIFSDDWYSFGLTHDCIPHSLLSDHD